MLLVQKTKRIDNCARSYIFERGSETSEALVTLGVQTHCFWKRNKNGYQNREFMLLIRDQWICQLIWKIVYYVQLYYRGSLLSQVSPKNSKGKLWAKSTNVKLNSDSEKYCWMNDMKKNHWWMLYLYQFFWLPLWNKVLVDNDLLLQRKHKQLEKDILRDR